MTGDVRHDGLLHVYTGTGKGKTSAAVGMAVRMAGHGQSVLFTQFLKASTSGEILAFSRFSDLIDVQRPPMRHKSFIWNQSASQRQETAADLVAGWRMLSGRLQDPMYRLFVFDELLDVIQMGMVPEKEVLQALVTRHPLAEVVLTGRAASRTMLEMADYATEMTLHKHPYERDIQARKGVEW